MILAAASTCSHTAWDVVGKAQSVGASHLSPFSIRPTAANEDPWRPNQ